MHVYYWTLWMLSWVIWACLLKLFFRVPDLLRQRLIWRTFRCLERCHHRIKWLFSIMKCTVFSIEDTHISAAACLNVQVALIKSMGTKCARRNSGVQVSVGSVIRLAMMIRHLGWRERFGGLLYIKIGQEPTFARGCNATSFGMW